MKRRYKLLLIIFISFILACTIYLLFFKPEKIYLAIKEDNNLNLYEYTDYLKDDLKNYKYKCYQNEYFQVKELISKINTDEKLNNNIKKANIITIDLGNSELSNYIKLNKEILNDYIIDVKNLLESIHKLNNNIIYIDNYDIKYLNSSLRMICNDLEIGYIGPKILNNYKYKLNDKLLIDYKGHRKVYLLIKSKYLNNN